MLKGLIVPALALVPAISAVPSVLGRAEQCFVETVTETVVSTVTALEHTVTALPAIPDTPAHDDITTMIITFPVHTSSVTTASSTDEELSALTLDLAADISAAESEDAVAADAPATWNALYFGNW